MKSNVSIKEVIPEEYTYPYLGISKTGIIVLFIEDGMGVTVNDSSRYDVGHYYELWDVDDFKLFDGEVTLSND